MTSARRVVSVLVVAMLTSLASAQGTATQPAPPAKPVPVTPAPTPAPVVGAEELTKVTAPAGFVDDAAAADADRLAYVVAETGAKAEVHVLTLSTKQEVVIDIAKLTLTPTALHFIGANRLLVIGKQDDGRMVAGAFELTAKSKSKPIGTLAWKSAPATHATFITRDGKPRVALHSVSTSGATTRHEVQLLAVDTGKRTGALRTLELENDQNQKLGFKVNHWSDGWTKVTGIRSGEWDKQEDQQSPDAESTYDFVTGKLGPRVKIADLYEQRRRFKALADANGEGLGADNFVHWSHDNVTLQIWTAGKPRTIELDQPIDNYDKKSLQGIVAADGSAWLAFKVDPVNPAAVARKKADPEYLDIFRVGPGADGRAVRVSRVFAKGLRHRLGTAGDRFWLLERNAGFDRGGKSLTLYRPQ